MPALNHYRKYLSANFEDVLCLASREFPEDLAKENGFDRPFTYLYNKYIPIMGRAKFEKGLRERTMTGVEPADPYEEIATTDAKNVLKDYDIDDRDVIYLPGVDFYSAIGFMNAIKSLPVDKRPKLFVRFIGVLETATQFYMDPLTSLCTRLRQAKAQGLRIYLSAETPSYADKLSFMTRSLTYVTPYPETSEQVPFPERDEFQVACVGSARLDKGFMSLGEIARGLKSPSDSRSISLVTQMMPSRGNDNVDHYTCQLYATNGVTLLGSTLTTTEIEGLYRNSNLVLLPYASDVYKYRGSAVLMEAASVGRPCVTLSGTAFAVQVEYYGLGTVVDSINDIAHAIRHYVNLAEDELKHRVTQARSRFFFDINASYNSWFLS